MPETAHAVELELLVRTFLQMKPPERVMRQFAAILRPLEAPEGTILYERGAPSGEVFLIAHGTIASVGEDGSRWMFEGQSFLGVLDATLDRPHSRTAVVEKHAEGARMNLLDYIDILEDNFDFAKDGMQRGCIFSHEAMLANAPDEVFVAPTEDLVLEMRGADPRRLEMVERLMVLHRSSFFVRAPMQPLVSLATLAEEERYDAGEKIFEFQEPNANLRFVVSGRVRAERQTPRVVAEFGPSDLLGGPAAVGYDTYQYTMTATRPTRILRIAKEDLFDVMEDHFRLSGTLFAFNARENERARRLTSGRETVDLTEIG